MLAGKALQLGVTAAIKGEVLATAERLVHGVAHQNLPATGFGGDACRQRAYRLRLAKGWGMNLSAVSAGCRR